ncbi:hypothetical protein JCM14469_09260 [Desulfatiferula olefinivorans]
MKRFSIGGLVLGTIILLCPALSLARYNPGWEWQTIETEHHTLYYPKGYEAFAARVMSLSDEVYTDVSGWLGVSPDRCPVVLNPGTDLFNGFYSPFPNRISLYETPHAGVRGFGPVSDAMDAVFTHEYAHFAHITTKLGWYGKLSRYLGRDSAITNILSPGWIIEGVTTNAETLFTDGGRGRCSYFRGKMLSMSEDEGLWNLSAAGIYPPYQPPGDRFYLAGYHMVEYLTRTYGEDAFARLSTYQAMHPLGLTDEALRHVTHKSADLFYQEFLFDYQKQAQAFKDLANEAVLPEARVVLAEPLGDIEAHFWTEAGSLMAYRTAYDSKNAFVEIDPRTFAVLRTVETGTMNVINGISPVNGGAGVVYGGYYPRLLGEGDLIDADLTVLDLASGKRARLTQNAHVFSADLSRSTGQYVAARRNGMWTDLIVVDDAGKNIFPLVSQPGWLFEAPVWSPDDSSIACVVKSGANADIALVDPLTGKLRTLFEPDRFEDNDPCFSPDGTFLVFSSNRSGIWNIFAWDMLKEKLYQLTSVDYGATSPKISPDGKTLSFLTLHRGVRRLCTLPFDPVKGQKYFVKPGGKPADPDLERLCPAFAGTPKPVPYARILTPFLHIPYIMSNEDDTQIGIWALGGDPVGMNSYSAFVNYGLDSEHAGYDLSLTHRSFRPDILARIYNEADEISYAGRDYWIEEQGVELALSANMINRVVPDEIVSRLTSGLRVKWLDSLTRGLSFHDDFNEARSFFADLVVQRSPDAPERDMLPTWGQSIIFMYEKTMPDLDSELSGKNAMVSFSQYLPSIASHHNLEARIAVQKQWGQLAYDKDYSLPRGYSTSDTEGDLYLPKNLLLSLEYHFPIHFPDRGLGLSVLHVNLLKGTVFADWGAGWDGAFSADHFTDIARTVVGGSFRAKTTLFSMLPLELGLEVGYKTDDEEAFSNLIVLFAF